MDVTVPPPETFAQPSRETLLCNQTQELFISLIMKNGGVLSQAAETESGYCYLNSGRPHIFLRFPFFP